MTGRDRRRLLALAALSVLWLFGHDLAGLTEGLLYLAPLITLLAPLLMGRFVGERQLQRLVALLRTRRRRVREQPLPRRRTPWLVVRSGRLIGASLAVRPPPAGPALP